MKTTFPPVPSPLFFTLAFTPAPAPAFIVAVHSLLSRQHGSFRSSRPLNQLQLPAIDDLHGYSRTVALVCWNLCDLLDDIVEPANNASEDDVFAAQVWTWAECDEELGVVRVWAFVGHAEESEGYKLVVSRGCMDETKKRELKLTKTEAVIGTPRHKNTSLFTEESITPIISSQTSFLRNTYCKR